MSACNVPTPPELADRYGNPRLSVLELCLTLHGDNTGSADPLSSEYRRIVNNYLGARLLAWKSCGESSRGFDEAVRALVIATLEETAIEYAERLAYDARRAARKAAEARP